MTSRTVERKLDTVLQEIEKRTNVKIEMLFGHLPLTYDGFTANT